MSEATPQEDTRGGETQENHGFRTEREDRRNELRKSRAKKKSPDQVLHLVGCQMTVGN